ncbi:MAG: aldehyde dehydrogenase [Elusimicrobia bacterium]|nr:aldehyde dehydrogenase [Elusimicrobiota bacterium]
MTVRVGINGFGRIGRLVLRAGLTRKEIEWVAVNDLTDAKTLAHLFKYDSTFGPYPGTIQTKENALIIDGREIQVLAQKDPAALPWKALKVDVVVESTGRFTDAEKARGHLTAGAKRIVISAPAKGEDITVCMGINEDQFDSYTNDQVILDFPHNDLRRARAAAMSMIPTTTGAAKAIGLVLPELKGKMNGIAIRVPTPNVSLVDLVAETERPTSKEEVNAAFKRAAAGSLRRYLDYVEEPLVSRDFNGNAKSCVFDALSTDVIEKTFVKVLGWYDNEWGYSNRVVDLVVYIAERLTASHPVTPALHPRPARA